jgi:hypothetical protein
MQLRSSQWRSARDLQGSEVELDIFENLIPNYPYL